MEGHRTLTLLLTIVRVVQLQTLDLPVPRRGVGNCAEVTLANLGSPDELTTQGIVAATFRISDAVGEVSNLVRIVRHLVVCEASGATRDTISSISVVVEYEWCTVAANPCVPAVATDQFQFDCLGEDSFLDGSETNGVAGNPAKTLGESVRTTSPTGTFATTPTDQCSECAAPAYLLDPDPDTHCLGNYM